MIKALYSGISGLRAQTQSLGVIGDNIANVSTSGFKSGRIDFANLLSQSVGGYTGQEVGSGVRVSNLSRDWTQGNILTTGNVTDLAINGNGFFAVVAAEADAADPAKRLYTRVGAFHFDDGFLKDNNGNFVLNSVGGVIKDPNFGSETPTISVSIMNDGTIKFDNGTATDETMKIGIAYAPCEMYTMDRNLYKPEDVNLVVIGGPGDKGTGSISSYSLEMSNVDLATEFGNMITTQRAFQASAKVITASDEVLQQLLSIKR